VKLSAPILALNSGIPKYTASAPAFIAASIAAGEPAGLSNSGNILFLFLFAGLN
jgi:hypothetical protein